MFFLHFWQFQNIEMLALAIGEIGGKGSLNMVFFFLGQMFAVVFAESLRGAVFVGKC